MVRLLGRLSDSRIYFQDSLTILDHGTTLSVGAGGPGLVNTHKKSVITGWVIPRTQGVTVGYAIRSTGAYQISIIEPASSSAGTTLDWWVIGYTT
jgi:hypothetical protein